MLHLILEHSLLHLKWLREHRCSRSRLSIPLRWKTIDRSHFSRSYQKPLRGQLPNRSQSSYQGTISSIQTSLDSKALLSVTEALKTARAAAQSSALVLLDLSAAFDTVVPHWALVQCVMARSAVCTSPPHHRGAPRLGDGTTSLCHLHHLARPYHPLAWFFLSLLCR